MAARGPALALLLLAGRSAAGPCDVFCVDFEGGAPPGPFSFGSNARVVNDKGHGSSGSSLYYTAKSGKAENSGFMKYTASLEGKYYGRVFYNIEKQSRASGGDVAHVSHVLHNMDPQNSIVDTCTDNNGKVQYEFNWGDDKYGKESEYSWKLETDKWVCAEWQLDHTNNNYNFWVDGKLVSDISGRVPKGRDIPSTYPNLWFGAVIFAEGGDEVSGWMDDIAISHSRIGCGTSPPTPAPGPGPGPQPPSPGTRYHCDDGQCITASQGHSTMSKCEAACGAPAPPPPAPSGKCGSVCKGDSTDDNCYHPSWSGQGVNKCSRESSQDACESDDDGQWCGHSVRLVNGTA